MRPLATKLVLALLAFTALASGLAGGAAATPGALRVAIVESQCEEGPATVLRSQILAQSPVAAVDLFDASAKAGATPTAAQLAPYDVVVAIGDCDWASQEGIGDALADYQDQGGVVVATTFAWQDTGAYRILGRWLSDSYSPYETEAPTTFAAATLVPGVSSLLDGVGPLTGYYRNDTALAPGATEIATWSDGTSALAVKGRALAVNAYIGNNYSGESGPPFSGDYGRLIVNAGSQLGKRRLDVTKTGNGSGTVSGSGIDCGALCSAVLASGATATLTATPGPKSSFAGWSGACTGTGACVVPLGTPVTAVTAQFDRVCVVPNLKKRRGFGAGPKRRQELKKILGASNCKLGKLLHPDGWGKVAKQWPKPGAIRPEGTKVKLKLKPLSSGQGAKALTQRGG